jgi:hypothetical protein
MRQIANRRYAGLPDRVMLSINRVFPTQRAPAMSTVPPIVSTRCSSTGSTTSRYSSLSEASGGMTAAHAAQRHERYARRRQLSVRPPAALDTGRSPSSGPSGLNRAVAASSWPDRRPPGLCRRPRSQSAMFMSSDQPPMTPAAARPFSPKYADVRLHDLEQSWSRRSHAVEVPRPESASTVHP